MIWWWAYIFDPNHHTIRGLWVYSPTLDFRGKTVDGVHDWLVSEAAPPLISNCSIICVFGRTDTASLNFDPHLYDASICSNHNGTHVEFSYLSLSLSSATMAIFTSSDSMMQHKQSAKFIMMIIVRTRGSRSFARYEGKVYASLS